MKILSSTSVVKKLVELLKKASETYYGPGTYYVAKPSEVPAEYREWLKPTAGKITDSVFDRLWDELKRIDPKNTYLKRTGAPVTNKKRKIKLPFPMPSLDKIKEPEAVQAWLDSHPGPYVVSAKKDGVSIGIRFGAQTRLGFTKGRDGSGGDISYMLDALRVPKIMISLEVRGEIIVRKDVFEKFYKKKNKDDKQGFENPRAMAAGITNRDELHAGLKHADVIVYEMISPRVKPSEQLDKLKKLGFNVVPHRVYAKLTAAEMPKILADLRARVPYELDGLVIVQDKKNPAPTHDYPGYAIAYKDPQAYEMADVVVENVEWNVTRTGRLFPRINIKPTRIGGTTVTYCSGKSGKTIENNGIGPGAVIRVQRAGDVIPDYVKTIKKVKPQFPDARKVGAWHWNGENIDLIEDHDRSALLGLQHFFTQIGVEEFKEATIQKFVDAGYDTIPAICNLSKRQWQAVPGTNKNIGNVWEQMKNQLNGIQLSTLMYASGVFGRSMGKRRFEAVLEAMPGLLKASKTRNVSDLAELIDEVPGFDAITAKQMAEGVKPFIKWLYEMPPIDYVVKKPKSKTVSKKLDGMYVVFTKIRDRDLEAKIAENGGEVGDSTAKMTILITKDPNASSTKTDAARAKGLPVLTVDQFKRRYNL